MPAIITLDDLAAMISADEHGRRYETSPEGVLSVVPPPDSQHAVIATRLMLWFGLTGWPAEQLMQAAGIRIPGPDGDGGRIPDLTVWSRPQQDAMWLAVTDLLVVVEILSRGSEAIDQVTGPSTTPGPARLRSSRPACCVRSAPPTDRLRRSSAWPPAERRARPRTRGPSRCRGAQ
jgi:Putative restriction endonuclease